MYLPVTLFLQLADRRFIVAGFFIHRHRLFGTTRTTGGFRYTTTQDDTVLPSDVKKAADRQNANFDSWRLLLLWIYKE